jgi:hypothetical protein
MANMALSNPTTLSQSPDIVGSGGGAPLGTTVYASSSTVPIEIVTTQPAQLLRHNISDEELEMLATIRREGLGEAVAATAGAAVALAPAVGETIWKAYIETPFTPISIFHLIEIVAFGATTAVGIAVYLLSGSRGNRVRELVQEIRGRREGRRPTAPVS